MRAFSQIYTLSGVHYDLIIYLSVLQFTNTQLDIPVCSKLRRVSIARSYINKTTYLKPVPESPNSHYPKRQNDLLGAAGYAKTFQIHSSYK